MLPPQIITVEKLTAEAKQAAYELIAETLRQQTTVLNVRLADVTYDGLPIGSFEISVRRMED